MIRRMSVAALLLTIVFAASPAVGGDVFLYNDAIADEVDVGRFAEKGEVAFLKGIAKYPDANKGPAPDPYPHIHTWEPGIEQLGDSKVEMDGILFINQGQHWVKNKLALVLCKIVIPNANLRMVSEFAEDMTLSMWVDWDQNEVWDKDELQIRNHFNIADQFPTTDETMTVYYLTAFQVPDVEQILSLQKGGKQWQKDIRYYWVRGTLACDDPDVSPDGEQIFGEVEDYRVSYMFDGKAEELNN